MLGPSRRRYLCGWWDSASRWRESQSGGLFPVLIYCPSLLFHSCATCWCAEFINVAIKLFFVKVLDFLHEFPVTVYVCYWLQAFFSPAVFCFFALIFEGEDSTLIGPESNVCPFYFETRIISEMHSYFPPWDCLFVCLFVCCEESRILMWIYFPILMVE